MPALPIDHFVQQAERDEIARMAYNLENRIRRYRREGRAEWATYAITQLARLQSRDFRRIERPTDRIPHGYRTSPFPSTTTIGEVAQQAYDTYIINYNAGNVRAGRDDDRQPADWAPVPIPPAEREAMIARIETRVARGELPANALIAIQPPPPPPAPTTFTLPAHFIATYFNMAKKCGEIPDCPICYDAVTAETIAITPCGHVFCRPCLDRTMAGDRWTGGGRCPTCRAH
jgi:hypothetical protein